MFQQRNSLLSDANYDNFHIAITLVKTKFLITHKKHINREILNCELLMTNNIIDGQDVKLMKMIERNDIQNNVCMFKQ